MATCNGLYLRITNKVDGKSPGLVVRHFALLGLRTFYKDGHIHSYGDTLQPDRIYPQPSSQEYCIDGDLAHSHEDIVKEAGGNHDGE